MPKRSAARHGAGSTTAKSAAARHAPAGRLSAGQAAAVHRAPAPASDLTRLFQALADPTRRAVLERLGRGAAPMSELARPFGMALPSFAQHLGVLEDSGLVRSQKSGRVRTYHLAKDGLAPAERWVTRQRAQWRQRLDQLDDYLLEMARDIQAKEARQTKEARPRKNTSSRRSKP